MIFDTLNSSQSNYNFKIRRCVLLGLNGAHSVRQCKHFMYAIFVQAYLQYFGSFKGSIQATISLLCLMIFFAQLMVRLWRRNERNWNRKIKRNIKAETRRNIGLTPHVLLSRQSLDLQRCLICWVNNSLFMRSLQVSVELN